VGLPKHHRLKRRQDFNLVYQRGIRLKSPHVSLRLYRRRLFSSSVDRSSQAIAPSAASTLPTRIGISISTKVDKRSVVRNRLRRQIQAQLRQWLPKLAEGFDLLIVVHSTAAQCDRLQFLQELEQLLRDAEVFDGH
jgi:ribonuclease P protein component